MYTQHTDIYRYIPIYSQWFFRYFMCLLPQCGIILTLCPIPEVNLFSPLCIAVEWEGIHLFFLKLMPTFAAIVGDFS